jgi:hypothetical protein
MEVRKASPQLVGLVILSLGFPLTYEASHSTAVVVLQIGDQNDAGSRGRVVEDRGLSKKELSKTRAESVNMKETLR